MPRQTLAGGLVTRLPVLVERFRTHPRQRIAWQARVISHASAAFMTGDLSSILVGDGAADVRGEEMEGLHEGGGERVGCAGEGGRGGVGTWPAATDLPAAVHVLNDDDVNMTLPANSGPGV